MIEREEIVTEKRVITLTATGGLSAEISDDGLRVTINSSTIDGQSALRISSGMVAALTVLAAAVGADEALVIPPEPEPEQPVEEPPAEDPTEPPDAP